MTNNKELFINELKKLLTDPKVRRLEEFPQHRGSNTLRHSVAVAMRSFELAEKLGWDIDEKELVRCAMLHDYYLYRIKDKGLTAYKHGTSHPEIAIRNAKKDFGLSSKEMSDMRSHMWPDKDVAIKEFAAPELKRAKRIVKGLKKMRES